MTSLERRAIRRANTHLHGMLQRCEEWVIAEALFATGWNKAQAARLVGMSRSTFLRKVRQLQLSSSIVFC